MRSFYLLLAGFFISFTADAQTWNGTNNTNWDDPTNWSGGSVPSSTGNVIIPGAPSGNKFPVFATNVSIGSINMQAGSMLDVNGKTFTLNAINVFILFTGATVNNSGAGSITINVNTGTGGYGMYIRNSCVFNGNTIFNSSGSNLVAEGDVAGSNTFNGNVSWNINSSLSLGLSNIAKTTYAGNLAITRTVAGATTMFGKGAAISGNFSYSNLLGGASNMGALADQTIIGGTININNVYSTVDAFSLLGVKNNIGGGSINVQGSQAFNIQKDTLLVSSLSVTEYSGNSFGFLYNNKIIGNLTLSDAVSYSGGYDTRVKSNTITGNTIYNINGSNIFNESNAANSTNNYDGNVSINITSKPDVNFSVGDTTSITGSLTITRTGAGATNAFRYGGSIGGNFSFVNNSMGDLSLGTLNSHTLINGKVTITKTDTALSNFTIYRLINQTAGGSITASGTRGFDIQKDTFLLSSLSVTDYQGTQYGTFLNNKITGNVTIGDNVNNNAGYITYVNNNNITGNTTYNIIGSNSFQDAGGAAFTNNYIGNVTYNIPGIAPVVIATGDTVAVTGNLIINRTGAGNTSAFGFGGSIGGNFAFSNNSMGILAIGNSNSTTLVNGTVNITNSDTVANDAGIIRLKNLTNGGSISLAHTRGFNMQNDTLLLNSLSITDYQGNQYGSFYNNKIIGDVTIADNAGNNGGYTTTIRNNNITGNTSYTISGSNTFGDADVTNSGNTYLGNTTYTLIGSGAMNVATVDTSYYGSGLTFNSSAALPINRKYLQFVGNANGNFAQTGTQSFTIPNVIMRKNPLAKVTLSNALTISSKLVLDSGILATTAANKLIIPAGITYTGGSNLSFVQGPMDKIGNTAFAFPVGMDTAIAPISISAPAAITDVFTASYIHKSPNADGYDSSKHAITLDHISRAEYWILNRTAGTSDVSVTLSYDTLKRSGRALDNTELRVSRWDGTTWTDAGNGGVTGTPVMGTVQSGAAITSFSPFTLASTTPRNTLPVKLIYFTATENQGVVTLNWKTENEINFSHYEVERSFTGNDFANVNAQNARNQGTENLYTDKDQPGTKGLIYYRLKMVDKDGKIAYSAIVTLKISGSILITLSPNPVKSMMIVKGLQQNSLLRIIDIAGRSMISRKISNNGDQQVDLSSLTPGVYIMQIISNELKQTINFIKE